MNDNKFEVGKVYRGSSLYGSSIIYTVMKRSNHQVTMKEQWIGEDTGDNNIEFTDFDIEIESGIERIMIWEYHEHKAYIYANEYV